MKTDISSRHWIQAGLCLALALVIPQLFHAIPNAGTVFLPMHLPVLLCGLICGPVFGLCCGLLAPCLSFVFTGMPVAAMVPGMITECALFGLIAGWMMRITKKRVLSLYAQLYFSLTAAMLFGRLISGPIKMWIIAPGIMTFKAWAIASFVTGLPGMILQLILIPNVVMLLMKAKAVTLYAK